MRRSKSRACSKCPEQWRRRSTGSLRDRSPIAGCMTPRTASSRTRRAPSRRDRRRLRHRDRSADQRRRRGHGASRRCAWPPHRGRRAARSPDRGRAQAHSVPRQQRADDDLGRALRPRRRARHHAARAEKPIRRRRPPAGARGRGARRLSRSGRADVIRSAAAQATATESPSPAARHYRGQIPAASRLGSDAAVEALRHGNTAPGLDGAAAIRRLWRRRSAGARHPGWRGISPACRC